MPPRQVLEALSTQLARGLGHRSVRGAGREQRMAGKGGAGWCLRGPEGRRGPFPYCGRVGLCCVLLTPGTAGLPSPPAGRVGLCCALLTPEQRRAGGSGCGGLSPPRPGALLVPARDEAGAEPRSARRPSGPPLSLTGPGRSPAAGSAGPVPRTPRGEGSGPGSRRARAGEAPAGARRFPGALRGARGAEGSPGC